MAKYVDADKLKAALDKETLIETDRGRVKYYDRTEALYMIDALSFEVKGELEEAKKVNEKTECFWKQESLHIIS